MKFVTGRRIFSQKYEDNRRSQPPNTDTPPLSTDASRKAESAASLAPRTAPAKVSARRDGAGMKPGRERLERRVVLEQIGPIRPHALVAEQLARLVRVRVRLRLRVRVRVRVSVRVRVELRVGLGLAEQLARRPHALAQSAQSRAVVPLQTAHLG